MNESVSLGTDSCVADTMALSLGSLRGCGPSRGSWAMREFDGKTLSFGPATRQVREVLGTALGTLLQLL